MRAKLANVKRGPLAATLAVLVIAVFGVLHTQGIGPGAPTFTSLQVVREEYAPLQKTITDTDAIARLYDAAQRLPRLDPNGAYNCNAGPPVVYHLAFMRGGGVVARMDLYPNGDFKGMGCAYVILVPNDRRAMTVDFFYLAERILNVPVFAPTASGSYYP